MSKKGSVIGRIVTEKVVQAEGNTLLPDTSNLMAGSATELRKSPVNEAAAGLPVTHLFLC